MAFSSHGTRLLLRTKNGAIISTSIPDELQPGGTPPLRIGVADDLLGVQSSKGRPVVLALEDGNEIVIRGHPRGLTPRWLLPADFETEGIPGSSFGLRRVNGQWRALVLDGGGTLWELSFYEPDPRPILTDVRAWTQTPRLEAITCEGNDRLVLRRSSNGEDWRIVAELGRWTDEALLGLRAGRSRRRTVSACRSEARWMLFAEGRPAGEIIAPADGVEVIGVFADHSPWLLGLDRDRRTFIRMGNREISDICRVPETVRHAVHQPERELIAVLFDSGRAQVRKLSGGDVLVDLEGQG